MLKQVQIPDIGGDEVIVTRVMVNVGESILVNQSLINVESDKASMEVPSPEAGVVKEVLVKVGDKVSTGTPILVLEVSSSIQILVPILPEFANTAVAIWNKRAGDRVKRDEVLAEIETDKVVLEVLAQQDGVLSEILQPTGSTVASQQLLGYIQAIKAGDFSSSTIQIPDIGRDEVIVTGVMVNVGDSILVNQSLINVESDKASMEVPSPEAGVVKEVLVKVGDKVFTGTPMLVLESPYSSPPAVIETPQNESITVFTTSNAEININVPEIMVRTGNTIIAEGKMRQQFETYRQYGQLISSAMYRLEQEYELLENERKAQEQKEQERRKQEQIKQEHLKGIQSVIDWAIENNIPEDHLPRTIEQLTTCTKLDISCLELTYLPETIGNLRNLTELKIYSNNLTQLPESIGNLSNLTKLNIDNNNLTQLPESIGKLSNLTQLNVWANNLTQLPESIGNLSNLTKLNIDNNNLTQLPESIGKLSNLTQLNVWANNLTRLPESIGKLSNLTELVVGLNPLTQLPESIGKLSNLIELAVARNNLTSLPESISKLNNLTHLMIAFEEPHLLNKHIFKNLTYLNIMASTFEITLLLKNLSDEEANLFAKNIESITTISTININGRDYSREEFMHYIRQKRQEQNSLLNRLKRIFE